MLRELNYRWSGVESELSLLDVPQFLFFRLIRGVILFAGRMLIHVFSSFVMLGMLFALF
jgi:hypothetical protein